MVSTMTRNGSDQRFARVARLLERTEAIAGIGSWEWSPATDELVLSNNLLRIVGLVPGSVRPTIEGALRQTHPADRPRLSRLLERARAAMTGGAPSAEPGAGNLRIVRPDGTLAHLHLSEPVEELEASGERRLIGYVSEVGSNGGRLSRAFTELSARLTLREIQVLQLAAEGHSTRAIAARLFLSPGTVKTHFQHIYAKLGVSDRAAAVAQALRAGLID